MTVAATSIKIPRRVKSKIERLARDTGESSHAFMLRALEGQVEATERYQAFLRDGVRADEAMLRSGLGYAAADVHASLAVLAAHPRIGRRADAQRRELVISHGATGYVALYRYDSRPDVVRILRIRHQREAGYRD